MSKRIFFKRKRSFFQRLFLRLMVLLILVSLFFSAATYLILHSSEESDPVFTPDLIAVFTGDKGRIPVALGWAKKEQKPLFISGVMQEHTRQTLSAYFQEPHMLDDHLIDVDAYSQNTIENVMATLSLLRREKKFKKVLVISHDYHLYRIKMIFEKLQREDESFVIAYYGVDSQKLNVRQLKIYMYEVLKILKTYAFILFW